MITNTDSIASLMDELSSKVGSDQDLYLIGGGAMMFMGSKAATKDVDLVVRGESAYTAVHSAHGYGIQIHTSRGGIFPDEPL